MTKKPAKKTRPQSRAADAGSEVKPPPALDEAPNESRPTFPIVGIGASAGGLEALDLFLQNVPEGSGMAFVIVQHLDPTHKGIMPELLQRSTPMKVIQVKDLTLVEPNCVYVIPPNKDMSILHGVLHLLDPVARRGMRLPIDFFFRSLADDAEERSIGVILSGMGTDGTLGLKAIKGKSGAVFVQDPDSAKFNGMPRSAVEAGLADVVAPVEALPGEIITYLHHAPLIAAPRPAKDDQHHSAFEKVVILLRAQTGHDFSSYKKNTVFRRIERRMGIHQIDRIAAYVRMLQENPQEVDILFKELLIGVTSFFRDPEAWEDLKNRVLPALLKERPPSQALRIWIPACATGEEAYSMAIVFKEVMDQFKPARGHSIQIFATDLDRDAIEKARSGIFSGNIAADVSPERLSRFFVPVDRGYQVAKSIREVVIFAPQNVIMDPPFTKLDLIICRNLLIYLTAELQKKLLPLFHYSLNPGGFLFLGSAESIGAATNLFAPLGGQSRLYQRLESGIRPDTVEFPAAFTHARSSPSPPPNSQQPAASLQSQAEHLLLQRYSPAAVMVNDKGDIIFISGRTGKYLEPAAGKANWNIFAMAREGLSHELSDAFRQALRQKDAVVRKKLRVGTNGGVQTVDLTVQTIVEPESLRGMVMIVFADVDAPEGAKKRVRSSRSGGARVAEVERELEQCRQDLQIVREEMQTSQEDAKSTHEELQSANEELQSANEELTTSKEEMQSMNEELQTLNSELLHKVSDLSRLNNDMKNLLDSTEIATVFLDTALRVRLFTSGSNRIFKLIHSDIGRPITDIAPDLDYPALPNDAREVLRTLVIREQEVATRDGRWFMLRIMPYRTLENVIDGLIITCNDISASKALETQLRKTQAGLEERIAKQAPKSDQAEPKVIES